MDNGRNVEWWEHLYNYEERSHQQVGKISNDLMLKLAEYDEISKNRVQV